MFLFCTHKKEEKENRNSNEIVPEEEERKELKEILRLSLLAMKLSMENEDSHTDPAQKSDNEKKIRTLSEQIAEKLNEQKASKSSNKDDVKQFTVNIEGKAVSTGYMVKQVLEEKKIIISWMKIILCL